MKSETIPIWGTEPAENMSEMGQANSHPVPGMAVGRLALELR